MSAQGTISALKATYGFISLSHRRTKQSNAFFHCSALSGARFEELYIGQEVEAHIIKGRNGKPAADTVRPATAPDDKWRSIRENVNFGDIHFGYASAEDEANRYPELLLEGFFDVDQISLQVIEEPYFLVLGPKGSGKSALREHLRLQADSRADLFVSSLYLDEFPFISFSKIINSDELAEIRYPKAWSWLLLLQILGSLAKDEGANIVNNAPFVHTVEYLQRIGLLPSPEIRDLVVRSAESSLKLMVPKFIEHTQTTKPKDPEQVIPILAKHLKRLCGLFKSDSKHLLIIDGLDDILAQEDIQYKSLSALVREANRLNLYFQRRQAPIKIVLLCRTDLFERLPGTNMNKIRQDSTIYLDWYRGQYRRQRQALVELVNRRARLTSAAIDDLFAIYFPPGFRGRPTTRSLLDFTRYTPRDFLQLLKAIQEFTTEKEVDLKTINMGIDEYSENYFLPEIRDELSGYMPEHQIDLLFHLLGSLRSREVRLNDLRQVVEKSPNLKELDLDVAMETLFECSAIGNVNRKNSDDPVFMSFKFRNKNLTFNPNEEIVIQYGLWRALNIPVTS